MTDDFCFDCKYSYVVDNMQACVWEDGLKSRQVKCSRYKKSWQKALLPFVIIILTVCIIMRIAIAMIWGV